MIKQAVERLRAMGFVVFEGDTTLSAGAYVIDVGGLDMLQGPSLGMREMPTGSCRLTKVDEHPEGSFIDLDFDSLEDALAFIEPMSQALLQAL